MSCGLKLIRKRYCYDNQCKVAQQPVEEKGLNPVIIYGAGGVILLGLGFFILKKSKKKEVLTETKSDIQTTKS